MYNASAMLDKDKKYDGENEFVPETNESTHNDVELEEEESTSSDKIKSLRKKLEASEKERQGYLEDLQRTKADFLNSKRRLEEQLLRDRERITERHMEELLPLADSFEMAMKDSSWEEADEKWRKGVEGIHQQLMNIFKTNGVEVLNPLGKEFNPYEHEALTDSGTNTIIADVIQKGYKIGERIIRPAKVAVGTK